MAWSDVTSVAKLSVELEDGTSQARIYGNGRNQIGIVVYVEALDHNRKVVSLTAEEIIKHAWLIDSVTGDKLRWKEDKSWNYTDIENHYHTISSRVEKKEDAGKTVKLYVQCTSDERARNKSIAVEVELTNPSATQKKYSTAEHGSSGFLSKVEISALESKIYTMADMDLKRDDTNSGDYELKYEIFRTVPRLGIIHTKSNRTIHWDQDNYYFSIKDPEFYIQHADISSYNGNEGAHQVGKHAFYNLLPHRGGFRLNNIFNVGYIWPMSDQEQEENVSLYVKNRTRSDTTIKENVDIKLKINRVPRALCLTRIGYEDRDQVWSDLSFWTSIGIEENNQVMNFIPNITIYDQYGNMGKFHAKPEDSDEYDRGNRIQILDNYR